MRDDTGADRCIYVRIYENMCIYECACVTVSIVLRRIRTEHHWCAELGPALCYQECALCLGCSARLKAGIWRQKMCFFL